jgi:excisionase family DNA binding protein
VKPERLTIVASSPRPTIAAPPARLLPIPDAAAYLGISEGTLRNWLSCCKLTYVKVGRLTRVSQRVLDDFIRVHTIPAVGE